MFGKNKNTRKLESDKEFLSRIMKLPIEERYYQADAIGYPLTEKPSKHTIMQIMEGKTRITKQVANYLRLLDNIQTLIVNGKPSYNVHSVEALELARIMYYFHKEGFLDSLEDYYGDNI